MLEDVKMGHVWRLTCKPRSLSIDKSQISNSDAHLSVLFFSKKASVSDNSYSAIEEGGHIILHFELWKLRRSTNCMFNDPEDV